MVCDPFGRAICSWPILKPCPNSFRKGPLWLTTHIRRGHCEECPRFARLHLGARIQRRLMHIPIGEVFADCAISTFERKYRSQYNAIITVQYLVILILGSLDRHFLSFEKILVATYYQGLALSWSKIMCWCRTTVNFSEDLPLRY